MPHILTIIVDAEGKRVTVQYFASDGLTPTVAIAALQAVEGKMQQEAIEAEVQRRVQAAAAQPDQVEAVEPQPEQVEETP